MSQEIGRAARTDHGVAEDSDAGWALRSSSEPLTAQATPKLPADTG